MGDYEHGGGGWPMWPLIVAALVLLSVGVVALDRLAPGVLGSEAGAMRFVYLILLLLILGPALFAGPLARALRHLVVWVAAGAVLVLGYTLWQRGQLTGETVGGELLPAQDSAAHENQARFVANSDGDFLITARVDHSNVRFRVDTGASDVMLTRADAIRIGFNPDTLDYTRAYMTANGKVFAAPVRIGRIVVGDVTIRDVVASVDNGKLDVSLLGMSFLSRLSGYEVRDGVLILHQ